TAPLFGAPFTLTNAVDAQTSAGDLDFEVVDRGVGVARYGFTLELERFRGTLRGSLTYESPRISDVVARGVSAATLDYLRAAIEQRDAYVDDVAVGTPSILLNDAPIA